MDPEGSLRVHKGLPLVPIVCQINPVSALFLFKNQLNTPRSAPKFSKWYISLSGFPTKTLHKLLLSHIRATCSAHFILLYFIILMLSYVE